MSNLNNPRKLAIFVIGNRGGIGKSKTSKTLVEGGRALPGVKLAAFDLDAAAPSLSPAYGIKDAKGAYDPRANALDPFNGILKFDGRAEATKIGGALNFGADILLFDLPGGMTDPAPIFGDVDGLIDEFDEEGYDIVVVFVVGNSPESARGVIPAMNEWGPRVKFIAAKNLGLAKADAFDDFDGKTAKSSGSPAETAAKNGALIVEIPAIDAAAFQMLNAMKCTIGELINHLEVERRKVESPLELRSIYRGLKKYLVDCEELFETVGILGFENAGESEASKATA